MYAYMSTANFAKVTTNNMYPGGITGYFLSDENGFLIRLPIRDIFPRSPGDKDTPAQRQTHLNERRQNQLDDAASAEAATAAQAGVHLSCVCVVFWA